MLYVKRAFGLDRITYLQHLTVTVSLVHSLYYYTHGDIVLYSKT